MQGRSVLFDKTARALADLGAGHLDGTWERRLRRYLAPDLLILDDFGLRAFSERQGEDLYELISERVRRGSTIATSNRPPTEWYALFPNAVLAEGALDRLINASHHVTLEGRSYRPRQRPDARERSAGPIAGERAENEAVRSPRTPATERARLTALGAEGGEDEDELKWTRRRRAGHIGERGPGHIHERRHKHRCKFPDPLEQLRVVTFRDRHFPKWCRDSRRSHGLPTSPQRELADRASVQQGAGGNLLPERFQFRGGNALEGPGPPGRRPRARGQKECLAAPSAARPSGQLRTSSGTPNP